MRLANAAFLLASAFLACSSPALALTATTYSGTIGKIPIIVELMATGKDGSFIGRYAYMSKGVDIPLHGVTTDGHLALEEEKACTEELCKTEDDQTVDTAPIGADWALTADGDGFSGTWKDKDSGKSLPIKLTRKAARDVVEDSDGETPDKLDPAYSPAMQGSLSIVTDKDIPYDFLKMHYALKQGKVVKVGKSAYRMDLDPRSKLDYPVVTKLAGENPAKLNDWLAQQRLQWSSTAFGCLAMRYLGMGWTGWGGEGTNGYDDGGATVTVGYLTPRLMSLTESGVHFCSDAHFNPFDDHRLVDAKTGQPVDLKVMLKGWVAHDDEGNVVDPANIADKSTLRWGGDDELAKFIMDHLNHEDFDDQPQCNLPDDLKTNLDMYVKDGNIVFQLRDLFDALAYSCSNDLASVPIKDARSLLTETGAKYFVELDK